VGFAGAHPTAPNNAGQTAPPLAPPDQGQGAKGLGQGQQGPNIGVQIQNMHVQNGDGEAVARDINRNVAQYPVRDPMKGKARLMNPLTEQRVREIVREELALFREELDHRFQELAGDFRSAFQDHDAAFQSHDRKHQQLDELVLDDLGLDIGRWRVGDHEVSDGTTDRHAFRDLGSTQPGHEIGLTHSSSPSSGR
jgi:hypothetical protein